MDFRGVVWYWAGLVRTATSVKNKIDAHLPMHGLKIKGTPFTKAYMADLRAVHDYKIVGYLNIVDAPNHERDEVSRRMQLSKFIVPRGVAPSPHTSGGVTYHGSITQITTVRRRARRT